MRIGELHSIGTELIKMRGVDIALVAAKRFDIAVSKVVGKDEYDVWTISRPDMLRKAECEQRQETQGGRNTLAHEDLIH